MGAASSGDQSLNGVGSLGRRDERCGRTGARSEPPDGERYGPVKVRVV
jgi:hypothetical protein